MKMNFSFIKDAGSAFLVLLFLCMGTFASAQSFTASNSGEELSILKEYSDSFVGKSAALNLIGSELQTLNSSTPNGGVAEATHSVKRAFVKSAGAVLKADGDVLSALSAGNNAAIAAGGHFASGINVNTESILIYYAELLSL